ncbi:MAG TPA: class I SAM-dependent methyltransferase [Planctomycetota bacterium]|nr:class I SAM-dependent methyltransferase [Planctomycetota bacterium]
MPSDRQPRIAELRSETASAALAEWSARHAAATDRLGLATFLRARFPPNLARALAEQFELRQRAGTKFAEPARMLFERKALEQATRIDVARWRAARVKQFAPNGAVIDATCGLGADTIALAEAGIRVLGIEYDETLAALAAHNLRESTGRDCVVVASAAALPSRAFHAYFDPDRRAAGARGLDPERWSPPLSVAIACARTLRGTCIKLAPAIELESCALPDQGEFPWHPIWVSAGGELRECSLWCGEWAGDSRQGEREAVKLDANASLSAVPLAVDALEAEAALRVRWLADPDPAVIRSGLLGNVAARSRSRPLAPKIAYLGSLDAIDDPLLDARPVLAACALDPKHVKRMLAEHDVGALEVRKRGHPEPAEVLARKFAGPGSRRGVLVVARLERGHAAYLLGP